MVRCQALTAAGEQCTRGAVKRNLCTQHARITNGTTIAAPEPWTCLRLSRVPSPKNGGRMLQKLRTLLKEGPKGAESGQLYMYYLEGDRNMGLEYWKIGMTERKEATTRVNAWKRAHGPGVVVVHQRSYPTPFPRFVERVVHLYLHHLRMHRTPRLVKGVERYHSVWAKTGKTIDDGQQKGDTEKLVAKNKHTEWFLVPMETAHDLIRDVMTMTSAWDKRKKQLKN